MLDNLKPTKLNKSNKVISNEDIEKIKEYTKDVSNTTKSVRDISGLNEFIDTFENQYYEVGRENSSLSYQLEQKDDKIYKLNKELSTIRKQ